MSEYLHGAYGKQGLAGNRVAESSRNAIVYIGTAPVQIASNGSGNVNKPVLCANMAQARAKLGYSEDWAKYTLCEAMKAHFELNGVGPVIFINVLDPKKHVKKTKTTKSLAPSNGIVTVLGAEDMILSSLEVTGKTKGTDYAVSYNTEKQAVTLTETRDGGLGTEALTITYQEADPAAVTEDDVIGTTDGYGKNTGVYAVQNVYQETGYIPSFLVAPGFSSVKNVHKALTANSRKISGHWDAYLLTDLPLRDGEGAVGMDTAGARKKAGGFILENETVYFPMAAGTDGHKYHLSCLAAANLQKLLADQEGIPYKTASNTAAGIIENLYLGESDTGRVFTDGMVNEALCKKGIASAAFVGGKWVIWGAHSADYDEENATEINISETNRMMLYYLSNDFQHRRAADIDRPMTANDIQSIVAEEQTRLDALVKIGALCYGECHLEMGANAVDDMVSGDFAITFNVTTTPLCKSLTATINWTEAGIETYYGSFAEN